MENEALNLSTLAILKEAFWYSFGPGILSGMALFVFFLARYQKVSKIGGFCGAALLVAFFTTQFLFHLGIGDVFYSLTLMLDFFHILRLVIALFLLCVGSFLFLELRKDVKAAQRFLVKVFYSFLKQSKLNKIILGGIMLVKSFFWGIFFGFFCGLWPLSNTMVSYIYEREINDTANFFQKIFLFDFVSVTPFLVILFFFTKGFKSESFRNKVLNSRLMLLVFSSVFFAIGCGVLMTYINFLI